MENAERGRERERRKEGGTGRRKEREGRREGSPRARRPVPWRGPAASAAAGPLVSCPAGLLFRQRRRGGNSCPRLSHAPRPPAPIRQGRREGRRPAALRRGSLLPSGAAGASVGPSGPRRRDGEARRRRRRRRDLRGSWRRERPPRDRPWGRKDGGGRQAGREPPPPDGRPGMPPGPLQEEAPQRSPVWSMVSHLWSVLPFGCLVLLRALLVLPFHGPLLSGSRPCRGGGVLVWALPGLGLSAICPGLPSFCGEGIWGHPEAERAQLGPPGFFSLPSKPLRPGFPSEGIRGHRGLLGPPGMGPPCFPGALPACLPACLRLRIRWMANPVLSLQRHLVRKEPWISGEGSGSHALD
ncbi:collagen alpha-1(I) chain-like [Sceloporus undulatus]|uniref:collagen alpha-1(I) chain-like n=1 Tax=Sceloporus undulatus TaxID=8520 RepID=UPI001C4CDBD0|nr:collagen alpha-1(I) chain-like [Sceloporus undulatus]